MYNFADAYGRLAQEEHGAHPIPQRLPSDRELADMVSNAEWIKNMLDNIRNVVQQSIMNERAREGARPKPPMEEEDATMYDAKSGYGHPEVKKRRNVSLSNSWTKQHRSLIIFYSVLHRRVGVIAAIGLTRPNGGVGPMALAHSATPVDFTTPSSNARDS